MPIETKTVQYQIRGRTCAYVDESFFVEGRGYRVSIVEENVAGHRPTGTWPYHGRLGETMPWFWGRTGEGFSFQAAQQQAADYNARCGLTKADVDAIVTSSMRAQLMSSRVRRTSQ